MLSTWPCKERIFLRVKFIVFNIIMFQFDTHISIFCIPFKEFSPALPPSHSFIFGNRKKLLGAKSGENGEGESSSCTNS